jgi:hypothetical protein
MVVVLVFVFYYSNSNKPKNAILLADREAPLGWVYLRVFDDMQFEFENRGLRDKDIYKGTVELKGDTLKFIYSNYVPKVGAIAIIGNNSLSYIEGQYRESLDIKLNKLTNP